MSEPLGFTLIGGKVQKLSEAVIPLTDRGFLYGHSVFETLLILNQKAVAWEDHEIRLEQSCRHAKITPPSKEILLLDVKKLLQYSAFNTPSQTEKMQLRIVVTGGNEIQFAIRNALQETLPPSNVYLICRPADVTSTDFLQGINLFLTHDLRGKGLINVKSSNYLPSLIALDDSLKNHSNDALYHNDSGDITECTTSNFVWIDCDNNFFTSHSKNQCLAGTTLILLNKCLLQIRNQEIQNIPLNIKNLSLAKGAAVISSVRGLVPVNKIDNNVFDLKETSDIFKQLNLKLIEEQNLSASSF